ncbi:MAG: 3'-5' exonuclease domain-containing protein 2 [Deltaproteobacteria bacterium]|nr:3'-5' exonuclease domain-containing protein 2 [Deltaproteobacteria bacterium]
MPIQETDSRPGIDRRMTKNEINECPIKKWAGPVHVIRSAERMAEAVQLLAQESILGFDTETRPAFRKGQSHLPALLQLAGENEVCIFQLNHLGLPGPLRNILADPNIIKAGVALDYDISELRKLAPFQEAGFVDLGELAKRVGIKNHGLRGLAAVLLGLRITKSAQRSNWAKDRLTAGQVTYAATDAWIGRELYQKLVTVQLRTTFGRSGRLT